MARGSRKKVRKKPKKRSSVAQKGKSAPSSNEKEHVHFRSPWGLGPGEDQLETSRPAQQEQEAEKAGKMVAAGKAVHPRLFNGKTAAGGPRKAVQGAIKGSSPGVVPASLPGRLAGTKGQGAPMNRETQNNMESLMGADFREVRIHEGQDAARMNEDLNARAFTYGKDIFFEPGAYRPQTREGRQLLAHELTHTLQQGATRQKSIQKKPKDLTSPRFQGNAELEDVYDGNLLIKKNKAKGDHVRILQQALLDAGYSVGSKGVDGDYGKSTKAAVVAFQIDCGFTGKDVDGIVGSQTMGAFDAKFGEYKYEKDRAGEYDPADPGKGTRMPTPEEKKRIEKAINTEPKHTKGGVKPTFNENVTRSDGTTVNYGTELDKTLRLLVEDQWSRMAKGKDKQRKSGKGLLGWKIIDDLAKVSKKATDAVFSGYKTGPALSNASGNLIDKWEHEDKKIKASKAYADKKAKWRVNKLLRMHSAIAAIDVEHGAIQSRAAETAIVDRVRTQIVNDYYVKLLEIHRNWPASAGGGIVKLQRYKAKTDAERRDYMWRYFGTIIHEYIHTLADSRYEAYHNSLSPQQGGDALREGVTDYLTKVVYFNHMPPSATLRSEVEGPFHDPLVKHPINPRHFYASSSNGEALAGIVGIRNLMSAYFLGQVELIGGK